MVILLYIYVFVRFYADPLFTIVQNQKQDKNMWDDDTTDSRIHVGMFDLSKTSWEKNSYSRNELAMVDRRDFYTAENKKRWR